MRRRVITFDLWNTLIVDRSAEERSAIRLTAIQATLAEAGIARTVEEVDALFDEAAAFLWADGVLEDVGPEGQAREVVRRLGGGEAASSLVARIAQHLGDAILRFPPAPVPSAAEVVGALAERSAVGLVSNTGYSPGRVLRPVLRDFGILPHLSVLAFSDEVGFRKPDARIFRHALGALRIEPAQALHVGDHLHADVGGGRALGMRTLWLAPSTDEADALLAAVSPERRPDFVAPSLAEAAPVLHAWLDGTL